MVEVTDRHPDYRDDRHLTSVDLDRSFDFKHLVTEFSVQENNDSNKKIVYAGGLFGFFLGEKSRLYGHAFCGKFDHTTELPQHCPITDTLKNSNYAYVPAEVRQYFTKVWIVRTQEPLPLTDFNGECMTDYRDVLEVEAGRQNLLLSPHLLDRLFSPLEEKLLVYHKDVQDARKSLGIDKELK